MVTTEKDRPNFTSSIDCDSEKDHHNETLEKRLWAAADQLRANSGLTPQQYSQPVLGLIFLRFAEVRFAARRNALERVGSSGRRGSRVDEPSAYHAGGRSLSLPDCSVRLLARVAGRRSRREGSERRHARHREAQPFPR
jgi:hypothetical protein